jgi:mannosyl-oligosaccharide glucosidase
LWHDVSDPRAIRHSCEDGDDLKGWGWTRHDGRNYGHQEITDPQNDMVWSLAMSLPLAE